MNMSIVRLYTLLSTTHTYCCAVDDCWSVKSGRNSTTHRIIPDTSKFPDGISGVASQIHDLGFKVGIYSSMSIWMYRYIYQLTLLGSGETTCAGYPASLGYEEVDAQSFAEWGIDCMSLLLSRESS